MAEQNEHGDDKDCAVGITNALVQCAIINCQLHGFTAYTMIGIASAALAQLCFRQVDVNVDRAELREIFMDICGKSFDTQAPIMVALRQQQVMDERATTTEAGHA